MRFDKAAQEVNWDKYESYPPRIKEFMMNPRAFTRKRVENLCRDFILSEKFMRDYANFLDWGTISIYQTLSEDFMRNWKHKILWYYATRNQRMSEEFMREMKDVIAWSAVPWTNIKTLDFMREFKNKLDWNQFTIQYPIEKVTYEFINEFQKEVWWNYLKFRGPRLPYKTQERYKEELAR